MAIVGYGNAVEGITFPGRGVAVFEVEGGKAGIELGEFAPVVIGLSTGVGRLEALEEGGAGDVGEGDGGGVEVEAFGLSTGVRYSGGVAFGADRFDPDEETDEEYGDGYLLAFVVNTNGIFRV